MSFTLPELAYPVQSLEPNIDTKTMEIHHGKHHAAYVTNVNNAIKDTPMDAMSIEELMANLDLTNMPVRNNGGGHYNHSLFWTLLSPHGGGNPSGNVALAINEQFGSYDGLKEKLSQAAMTRFGSGWAWLCVHKGGKLEVCSTPNQDNPLMPTIGCGGTPIIGIDVWEHAYYLQYQNRRADYLANFFNVLNWEVVESRFNTFK
ncbi:MAG: superoxide dismutase [Saprospiraceae bacterium]